METNHVAPSAAPEASEEQQALILEIQALRQRESLWKKEREVLLQRDEQWQERETALHRTLPENQSNSSQVQHDAQKLWSNWASLQEQEVKYLREANQESEEREELLLKLLSQEKRNMIIEMNKTVIEANPSEQLWRQHLVNVEQYWQQTVHSHHQHWSGVQAQTQQSYNELKSQYDQLLKDFNYGSQVFEAKEKDMIEAKQEIEKQYNELKSQYDQLMEDSNKAEQESKIRERNLFEAQQESDKRYNKLKSQHEQLVKDSEEAARDSQEREQFLLNILDDKRPIVIEFESSTAPPSGDIMNEELRSLPQDKSVDTNNPESEIREKHFQETEKSLDNLKAEYEQLQEESKKAAQESEAREQKLLEVQKEAEKRYDEIKSQHEQLLKEWEEASQELKERDDFIVKLVKDNTRPFIIEFVNGNKEPSEETKDEPKPLPQDKPVHPTPITFGDFPADFFENMKDLSGMVPPGKVKARAGAAAQPKDSRRISSESETEREKHLQETEKCLDNLKAEYEQLQEESKKAAQESETREQKLLEVQKETEKRYNELKSQHEQLLKDWEEASQELKERDDIVVKLVKEFVVEDTEDEPRPLPQDKPVHPTPITFGDFPADFFENMKDLSGMVPPGKVKARAGAAAQPKDSRQISSESETEREKHLQETEKCLDNLKAEYEQLQEESKKAAQESEAREQKLLEVQKEAEKRYNELKTQHEQLLKDWEEASQELKESNDFVVKLVKEFVVEDTEDDTEDEPRPLPQDKPVHPTPVTFGDFPADFFENMKDLSGMVPTGKVEAQAGAAAQPKDSEQISSESETEREKHLQETEKCLDNLKAEYDQLQEESKKAAQESEAREQQLLKLQKETEKSYNELKLQHEQLVKDSEEAARDSQEREQFLLKILDDKRPIVIEFESSTASPSGDVMNEEPRSLPQDKSVVDTNNPESEIREKHLQETEKCLDKLKAEYEQLQEESKKAAQESETREQKLLEVQKEAEKRYDEIKSQHEQLLKDWEEASQELKERDDFLEKILKDDKRQIIIEFVNENPEPSEETKEEPRPLPQDKPVYPTPVTFGDVSEDFMKKMTDRLEAQAGAAVQFKDDSTKRKARKLKTETTSTKAGSCGQR